MPIPDKKLLLCDIKDRLDEYVPGKQTKQILEDIADILEMYEVENIPGGDVPGEVESMQYLNQFLSAKDVEGSSDGTIERYRYVMMKFLSAIPVPLKKITVDHLRQYLSQEKQRGLSMVTIKGNFSVISSFYSWMRNEGVITVNPTAAIGAIKAPVEKEDPFTDIDIYKLTKACTRVKQEALINFLLCTGCRVSEVCSIDIDDVDFYAKRISVIGKGRKQRIVYLNDITISLLQEYLKKRKDNNPALWVDRSGERWTPPLIRKVLKELGRKAGVENVHPHRFRHTLATQLAGKGMKIQEVAQVLGHAKIDTTMLYVTVSQRNTESSYRKYAYM